MKMKARPALLVLFFLSLIAFFVSIYFENLFSYVAAMHMALLFLGLYFVYDKDEGSFLKKVGIPGDLMKNALYTFGGLASVFIMLIAATIALSMIGVSDDYKVIDVANSLPLSVVAIAIFLAPFSEEFFFRAFLSSRFGIIVSSLIFGVFHFAYGSMVEIIGAFLIGVILAFVYKRSGSIIPPILIHLIYNLASLSIMRGFA